MIKAIIVDDDANARDDLLNLLGDFSEIKVVATAQSVAEAKEQLSNWSPELIFLDVEMPEENGFELIDYIEDNAAIIFTTAYPDFAVKAFEVNAVDYLVKPLGRKRLINAIDRVCQQRDQLAKETKESLLESSDKEEGLSMTSRLFIKDGNQCWFVRVESLRLVESEGNYVRLYFQNEKPLVYRTMRQMEERLPSNKFFRANRSQLMNLDQIMDVRNSALGGLIVVFKDGKEVKLSRKAAQDFKQAMSL